MHDKLQTYLINIVILEGRHYAWSSRDTAVTMKIDNKRKSTSVRYSTDCPYYNEYFVFEFNSTLEKLLDKNILITVLQPKSICRKRKILGYVNLDLATVWSQADHQFYHKWAVLSSPKTDVLKGFRGYLKLDICIMARGEAPKIPLNVETDEIEKNLLTQDDYMYSRQNAFFIFDIYRCNNLILKPSNTFTKIKDTGPTVFIEIHFAGSIVRTSTIKNNPNPTINERLVISELFPTLCQRIKIEVHYDDCLKKPIHSSHYIPLKLISSSKEEGFLPTFGPAYIHLYTKNSLQGYAGSIFMSMKTELKDITLKEIMSMNEVIPLNENMNGMEEIHLFSIIKEVTNIQKMYYNKPISFRITQGHNTTFTNEFQDCNDILMNATEDYVTYKVNKNYCFLKLEANKPCLILTTSWPSFRTRMYNSNILNNLSNELKMYLNQMEDIFINKDYKHLSEELEELLTVTLDKLAFSAEKYIDIATSYNINGSTELDRERINMCIKEMTDIADKAKIAFCNDSKKKIFIKIQKFSRRIELLIEDAQHCWPDVFLWMVSGNKKVGFVQIPSRGILHSIVKEEYGQFCSVEQTLNLIKYQKNIPEQICQVTAIFWLGLKRHKSESLKIIPDGFHFDSAEREPRFMIADFQYNFQCRAHIFQGRIVPGFDKSGLSDPFVQIIIANKWKETQIKKTTLNPIWDQTLIIHDIILYGSKEYIKSNPPNILIEVYDKDMCNIDALIGRGYSKPVVKMIEDDYKPPKFPPKLVWYKIYNETEMTAHILAAFELLEISGMNLEDSDSVTNAAAFNDLVPIPEDIRPIFSAYRIEVLFWGVRNLKYITNIGINKPRISIICQDSVLNSETLINAKKNLNFLNPIKSFDVKIPEQEEYSPPITIKMFDSRSFGIYVYGGVHITSIQPYIEHLMTLEERQNFLEMTKFSESSDSNKSSVIEIMDKKFPSQNSVLEEKNSDVIKNQKSFEGYCTLLKFILKIVKKKAESQWANKSTLSMSQNKITEKQSSISFVDDDNNVDIDDYDWWTKFYASEKGKYTTDENYKTLPSEKYKLKIYQSELENQPEFKGFSDMLVAFDIFKGKRTGDEAVDEDKITGVFKGQLKIYRWPPKDENTDYVTLTGINVKNGSLFQNYPSNDPLRYIVRIYCVRAFGLRPKDLSGKSDPYIRLILHNQVINDVHNYIPRNVNPVFGRVFEFQGTFPKEHSLIIEVWDWDRTTSDDLIGITQIDLENRFYTKYRAHCGLQDSYQLSGYCQWRDPQKPSTILEHLCKEYNCENPIYEEASVKIGTKEFISDQHTISGDSNLNKEVLALAALRRWKEMPLIGFELVPEHIETRSLYNPGKPGLEQGKLQLWIDILPVQDQKPLPKPIDIAPRKPISYELRVIIWNTEDVLLTEDDYFLGEKKSDIYIKGWLTGLNDAQCTDVHYRSLTGEGNFNWRFSFQFEYLSTENKLVIRKKESAFALDVTEMKIPCKLTLQVWDNDTISPDDFIGIMTLELARLPRGAPNSKKCNLSILEPNAKTINLFKVKRTKGWWPFHYVDPKTKQTILSGKLEAELEIVSKEESDKTPAGLGRDEPQALPPPQRPDVSFSWFKNPLNALKFVVCKLHGTKIIIGLLMVVAIVFVLMGLYAFPGYTVKKFLGV